MEPLLLRFLCFDLDHQQMPFKIPFLFLII
jgi:hypothetical protein